MVAYQVKENNEILSSAHGNDSLVIWLKSLLRKNETRTFEILYQGIPADGLIISRNRYGDRTSFGDNWPDRATQLIPCKDEPGDKATFEFLCDCSRLLQGYFKWKIGRGKDHRGQ